MVEVSLTAFRLRLVLNFLLLIDERAGESEASGRLADSTMSFVSLDVDRSVRAMDENVAGPVMCIERRSCLLGSLLRARREDLGAVMMGGNEMKLDGRLSGWYEALFR